MPSFPLALKTLHRHWYCGKFFKVKGVQYLYEEAVYLPVESVGEDGEPIVTLESHVKFSDSKQRFTMREEQFFSLPKAFYDSKGNKY